MLFFLLFFKQLILLYKLNMSKNENNFKKIIDEIKIKWVI